MDNHAQRPLSQGTQRKSIDKPEAEVFEDLQTSNEELWVQQYDLLNGKSKEEMILLNKKVLKKLDWRFLSTITAMLLMNYLDRINVSNARLAGFQEAGKVCETAGDELPLMLVLFNDKLTLFSCTDDRRTMVCRYLVVLCWLHHLSGPGKHHYRKRTTAFSAASLYVRVVSCDHFYGCHQITSWIHDL